jgi:hypothetical protein
MGATGSIGPAGPQGPAGGFSIRDAGVFAGQVGFLEPAAANFSLLPGAAGAVGTAAADAACALAYPGSRAELDMLVLWKAALLGHLPPASPAFAYWASSASDIPLFKSGGPGGNFMPHISDCDNWSNNVTGPAPYVKVGSGPGITDAYVGFNFCSNNGLAVACFTPPAP